MLSSKTIEMAIKALVKEQGYISYTETVIIADKEIVGRRQSKEAAERGIKEWEEYENAINQLKDERIRAVERENAIKA